MSASTDPDCTNADSEFPLRLLHVYHALIRIDSTRRYLKIISTLSAYFAISLNEKMWQHGGVAPGLK